jgi:methionine synthase II (cobalamin-independent)
MTTLHRADVIGSLLRPAFLQEARSAWGAGRLTTPEFKRIEDRDVDQAIALQEAGRYFPRHSLRLTKNVSLFETFVLV